MKRLKVGHRVCNAANRVSEGEVIAYNKKRRWYPWQIRWDSGYVDWYNYQEVLVIGVPDESYVEYLR